jgi:hypothetical protein
MRMLCLEKKEETPDLKEFMKFRLAHHSKQI